MFSINLRDVYSVSNYKQAVEFYKKSAGYDGPRKAREYFDHPLIGKPASPQMGVRMDGTDVVFRFHAVDVVTWHKTGAYTFRQYNSISTSLFFENFTPFEHQSYRGFDAVSLNDTAWPLGRGSFRVKNNRIIGKTGAVFVKTTVNRAGAKAVLANTAYAEYRDWYKAVRPLLGGVRHGYMQGAEVVSAIEDKDRWIDIVEFDHGHPDKVRQAIYEENADKCYTGTSHKTLPTSELRSSNVSIRFL